MDVETLAIDVVDEILGPHEGRRSIHKVIAGPLTERAGPAALNPGPEIDAALTRLVDLLTTRFEIIGRNDLADHWEVVTSAWRRIHHNTDLDRRASAVRRAAGLAESLMEIHHAERLLGDRTAITSADGHPLRSLRRLLRSFPYVDNYEALVQAELAGFGRLSVADRVAFCGAGALPLTAILWHLATGSAVTLIEIDAAVADLARRVVQRLDRESAIDGAAFSVEVADAAKVDVSSFDLIAVASLVPNAALTDLARAVVDLGRRGPVMMARSAVGLTSLLAYEAVDVQTIAGLGLWHLGTVAPANQVSDLPDLAGIAVPAIDGLLHRAPAGVLNTSEFFAADRSSAPISSRPPPAPSARHRPAGS